MIAWISAHPELVAWLLVSALSLVASAIEARAPRVAAAIRAVGLDVPGVVRAMRPLAPPPPPEPKADDGPVG